MSKTSRGEALDIELPYPATMTIVNDLETMLGEMSDHFTLESLTMTLGQFGLDYKIKVSVIDGAVTKIRLTDED